MAARKEGREIGWEDAFDEIEHAKNPDTEPIPRAWPQLAPVFAALDRMGRDGDGRLLHSERTSWLDENRVTDPEERELFHRLFDAAEAERSEKLSEIREEMKDRAK